MRFVSKNDGTSKCKRLATLNEKRASERVSRPKNEPDFVWSIVLNQYRKEGFFMEERNFARARLITVFASFLAFMGIGVVDPILPVIAEQIGASHWQVEMLFTAYIFIMSVMMIPAGILASRAGDKRLMVAGLIVVTIFSLLCGLSQNIPELSIFRGGWGLGNSMFFATAMTLLIALSDDAQKAVGLYEAAIGLGMAGGPLVGGLLGDFSWRFPFIATGILIFTAFLLVAFFVFEPSSKQTRKPAGLKDLKNLFTFPPFLIASLSGMLYYYGFFVVLAYTPLTLGLSAIQIGLVFCGWGLFLAYGSAGLAHKLEEKYSPKQILPFSLLVFAMLVGTLFFVHSSIALITIVIISGLACGLNNALFTSYVVEVSPYERGVTSGTYNCIRWIGAAVAPVLSGYLGESISAHTPFIIACTLAIISILLMMIKPKQAKVSVHKTIAK